MPLLLVATVGGSPAPIVYHLTLVLPDARVIFICSQDSETSVTAIKDALQARGTPLPESACEIPITLLDPFNLTSCIATLQRDLAPQVANWLARGTDFKVSVNITGGTKTMSAALAAVAMAWPCSFTYVSGKVRDKGGLGDVLSGSEVLIEVPSPFHSLNIKVIQDAAGLANSGDWSAAATILSSTVRATTDPSRKRTLASLEALFQGFAHWDRFQHDQAAKRLADAQRGGHDLSLFLSPACLRQIESRFPAFQATLAALANSPTLVPKIADLLANAERRFNECRYDDAVARSYRVIEAIAQHQLAEYGIPDTAHPDPAILPNSLGYLAGKPLALQDAFRVLAEFNNDVGQLFLRLGLAADPASGVHSPLNARNNSILAHGWKPVGADSAELLLNKAFQLAGHLGITRDSLVRYPTLTTL